MRAIIESYKGYQCEVTQFSADGEVEFCANVDGATISAKTYYALTAKIDRALKKDFVRKEVFLFGWGDRVSLKLVTSFSDNGKDCWLTDLDGKNRCKEPVKNIVDATEERKSIFEAINKKIADFDILESAHNEEIEKLFQDLKK